MTNDEWNGQPCGSFVPFVIRHFGKGDAAKGSGSVVHALQMVSLSFKTHP
jgi:hypothetical protein